MSKVPVEKMIAYMRGELELPTLPEALAVDTAIIEVLMSMQAAQAKDKPAPLPIFNEDAIGFAIRMMVEVEKEILQLTPLSTSENVSEEAKVRFVTELQGKQGELAWIKRELKELYDLHLLHLRARVMDYEREIKAHSMDAFFIDEMNDLIRGLNVKIEKVKTAMSKL